MTELDLERRRELRSRLGAWYAQAQRDLPWRRTREAYRIWLSEVMLQQTRVEAVIGRYEAFLDRFPTLRALALAAEGDVLEAWTGLGYYRRARALHQAARVVLERHGGEVPDDPEAFQALPGVGAYTAGAVLSIAFGRALPAVDGNVIRVLARLFRIREDPRAPATRRRLDAIAAALVADGGAGDEGVTGADRPPHDPPPAIWNQALMELGALVCVPRAPRCLLCPLADHCDARRAGDQARLPLRPPRRPQPEAEVALGACVRRGRLLVVRRPGRGLLAGMWGLPIAEEGGPAALAAHLGLRRAPDQPLATWRHAFTHRVWCATLYRASAPRTLPAPLAADAVWLDAAALRAHPFPTAFAPGVAAALALLDGEGAGGSVLTAG